MSLKIKVPSVGESVKEVTLANWPKNDGDYVEMDEVICEIESDKATVELTAEAAGVLKILVQAGETVPVGHIIGEIDQQAKKGASSEKVMSAAPTAVSASPASNGNGHHPAPNTPSYSTQHPSPAAGKILSEKGLSAQDVTGTGKDGRITKQDALTASSSSAAKPIIEKNDSKILPISAPAYDLGGDGFRETRKEKMSPLRKTIARRLVDVKNQTAMLTTFNEVDMSAVMELRNKYKDLFKEKHQVGLGFMSFFTKAATLALQEFPAVNAIIQEEEIIYHHYTDVGIAVSTPKGLVVPIIRNAEKLSLAQIEKEVMRLATKARDNKITMDDMSGGTFTITNGGVFGSMLSTPIINAPQSAILGMHNIVERPVAVKGQVVIRPIMYLALSYDHRIIDGRESVSFLKKIKEYVEDPSRLLLGV